MHIRLFLTCTGVCQPSLVFFFFFCSLKHLPSSFFVHMEIWFYFHSVCREGERTEKSSTASREKKTSLTSAQECIMYVLSASKKWAVLWMWWMSWGFKFSMWAISQLNIKTGVLRHKPNCTLLFQVIKLQKRGPILSCCFLGCETRLVESRTTTTSETKQWAFFAEPKICINFAHFPAYGKAY